MHNINENIPYLIGAEFNFFDNKNVVTENNCEYIGLNATDDSGEYYGDYDEDTHFEDDDEKSSKSSNYYDGRLAETVKLAKKGDAKGLHDLGYRYYWGFDVNQNRDMAFRYFLMAARKGYLTDYLARCIRMELQVNDEVKAKKIVNWLAKADNLDNAHDKDFKDIMAKLRARGFTFRKSLRRRLK